MDLLTCFSYSPEGAPGGGPEGGVRSGGRPIFIQIVTLPTCGLQDERISETAAVDKCDRV